MSREYNKIIVVSAINLIDGGTFTILKDCFKQLAMNKEFSEYKKIFLVNNKECFSDYLKRDDFCILDFPKSKKSYFIRLYYEYIYFYFFSKRISPEVWFSLHDITPNVDAGKRYVYMHNPSPFYKHEKHEKITLKFRLFTLFYKYIYKINARRNTAIIVQQDWLRNEISKLLSFPKEKIIVAYPEFDSKDIKNTYATKKGLFFFPSFPREFKNFEIICEACKILEEKYQIAQWYKVAITINGTENKYSKYIYSKYKNLKHIEFVGVLNLEQMVKFYEEAECLIFPSKLETWGLPISEFKIYDKKMLLADLPYAHETSSGAKKVCFFDPYNASSLANFINDVILGNEALFKENKEILKNPPFCNNWQQLFYTMSSGEFN